MKEKINKFFSKWLNWYPVFLPVAYVLLGYYKSALIYTGAMWLCCFIYMLFVWYSVMRSIHFLENEPQFLSNSVVFCYGEWWKEKREKRSYILSQGWGDKASQRFVMHVSPYPIYRSMQCYLVPLYEKEDR